MEEEDRAQDDWQNPIDKDKVTESPGTLAYPHHAGSAVVKPEDKGKMKGRAMAAMYEQTDQQLVQIKRQMELLAQQARAVQKRIDISQQIYEAEMNFEPVVGHVYHLYEKENGKRFLSMLSPTDWGRKKPFQEHLATARLMADHTWDVFEENNEA